MMTRGIGDGYYDMPLTDVVKPLEIAAGEDGLLIRMATLEDVLALADSLRVANEYCHMSFGEMRI